MNALSGKAERDGRLGLFLLLSLALHASLLLAVLRPLHLSLPAARDAGPLAVRLRTVTAPPQRQGGAAKPVRSGQPTRHESKPSAATSPATTTTAPVRRRVARASHPPAAPSRQPHAASQTATASRSTAPGKNADRSSHGALQHAAKAGPRPSAKAHDRDRRDAAGGFNAGAARSRVLAQVQRNLHRYFHYPGIAQRRGWEGRVVLDFAVRGDGRISDIRVAHSSGHAVLDRSAVRALRRVGRLNVGSRWPAGGLHNVKLPVIYRLEG